MLYRVAWEIDRKLDRKQIHAHASALKLHCSEMAGRVIDKALQILGGRGYMRENPVERLYRDIRVDRIWEGTSAIQRMVVGGQIKKRGLGEIGRASWRERVCQYVESSVVAVSLKKKTKINEKK